MLWSLRYCSKFAVEKLPQISQILTDVRARISPTESTDLTERLAENILPQISL